jgi:hypothetical protein
MNNNDRNSGFADVYRDYFGNVSILFDGVSYRMSAQLPYVVPSIVYAPVDNPFGVGYIRIDTGEICSSVTGAPVACLFDADRKAASEMASKVMGRAIDLGRLLADLDACALDMLHDVVDLEPFDLVLTPRRVYRLGPASIEALWARGEPPKRFRPPTIEFRGPSVWVVAATLTTSSMLLDPFGAISRDTARDIIIGIGQA